MSTQERFQTIEEIKNRALRQHNNGTDNYYRHFFCKNAFHTDGALAFFEAAQAHWLWDVIATEFYDALRQHAADKYYLTMTVEDSTADIVLKDFTGKEIYKRHVGFTDCPTGEILFYLGWHGQRLIMCLPSED